MDKFRTMKVDTI